MALGWFAGPRWRWSRPWACGPTRDVRHRTKVAVERYPASGDETRAVLKELTSALTAQPEAKTLREWSTLTHDTSEFAKSVDDMSNPNIDEKQRPHVAPVMTQRKEHLLLQLKVVGDQCGAPAQGRRRPVRGGPDSAGRTAGRT